MVRGRSTEAGEGEGRKGETGGEAHRDRANVLKRRPVWRLDVLNVLGDRGLELEVRLRSAGLHENHDRQQENVRHVLRTAKQETTPLGSPPEDGHLILQIDPEASLREERLALGVAANHGLHVARRCVLPLLLGAVVVDPHALRHLNLVPRIHPA